MVIFMNFKTMEVLGIGTDDEKEGRLSDAGRRHFQSRIQSRLANPGRFKSLFEAVAAGPEKFAVARRKHTNARNARNQKQSQHGK